MSHYCYLFWLGILQNPGSFSLYTVPVPIATNPSKELDANSSGSSNCEDPTLEVASWEI